MSVEYFEGSTFPAQKKSSFNFRILNMITVSCRVAHSFKIIRIPQPIILVRAPLQPVTVLWSGSADALKVPYICCLNGRVPEAFELWALADDRVCEVHPYARVKLRSEFSEDTFKLSSSIREDSIFISWFVEL